MYYIQKKSHGFAIFLLVLLCAFAIGLGAGYAKSKAQKKDAAQLNKEGLPVEQREPVEEKPASAPIQTDGVSSPVYQYFVVEDEGTVCVFTITETGEKRFSHTLAIELSDLRQEDKTLLKEGITLKSKEELLSFIEDFTS